MRYNKSNQPTGKPAAFFDRYTIMFIEPSLAVIATRSSTKGLADLASSRETIKGRESLGFVVALVNPIGGYWRILDYDSDSDKISELQANGFQIATWAVYDSCPDEKSKVATPSECLRKVSSQVSEIKDRMEWLSLSLERKDVLDPNFHIPVESGYQPRQLHQVPKIRETARQMRMSALDGD